MHIQYRIRQVYGNDSLYVVDPKIAALLQRLTGRKTLAPSDMDVLTRLGHTFEQVI